MGEKRNVCRIMVGKPEGKIPLGRPRRRCVDTIKMYIREREREGMVVWSGLIWLGGQWRALVTTVMNLRIS
jgi:hypothetical protein